MSKFSSSVNSYLEYQLRRCIYRKIGTWTGSFWVEIGDASWACKSMQLKICASFIVSTDLWPQRCLLFLICSSGLQWSYLKAVSVPTFVLGSIATSAFVIVLNLLICCIALKVFLETSCTWRVQSVKKIILQIRWKICSMPSCTIRSFKTVCLPDSTNGLSFIQATTKTVCEVTWQTREIAH